MTSFFVGSAQDAGSAHAVHDRSRCPAACFGHAGVDEYLGEYEDEAQALAIARLRYGGICHCTRRDEAWPWPAPVHLPGRAFIPPPP
jgi:hypothetical protein